MAQMFEKIAVIKTGWSEDYRGATVRGNYSYPLPDHEKVNFLPGPDGSFMAYIPPTNGSPPVPNDQNGWLVFAVSRNPESGGLYVVGWYEEASFTHRYLRRPEYEEGEPWFGRGADGNPITYALVAPRAYAIDRPDRSQPFRGDKIKRHIAYLRGNGITEPWRDDLIELLLAFRSQRLGAEAEEPIYVSPEEGATFKYGGGRYGGGGESAFHESLRLWVKDNPQIVVPAFAEADTYTEYDLHSGDRVDCVYSLPDRIAVLEVKSWISNDDDVHRGVFQCIKYRSVMEAMSIEQGIPVEAYLVTEEPVSGSNRELLDRHNINLFIASRERN